MTMSCFYGPFWRLCLLLISLLALFTLTQASLPESSKDQAPKIDGNCGTNTSWHVTKASWESANTDKELALWWGKINSTSTHGSVPKELAQRFGRHINAYECGIDTDETCNVTPCSDYYDKNEPVWSYLALQSIVKLSQFFNIIYNGIYHGQIGYLSWSDDIANKFFSWKDPDFVLGDVVFWIVASITALFVIPAVGKALGLASATAIGAFVGAGTQYLIDGEKPGAIDSNMPKSEGLGTMKVSIEAFATDSRNAIANWTAATMEGKEDDKNMTILDYLNGGAFLLDSLPTDSQVADFYKKQMTSRLINRQWKKEKVFVSFFKVDNPENASGPKTTRFYANGGVYYLYRYNEDGVLRGHLDKPKGLDHLNGVYNISGSDIIKASAGAFNEGKFNYSRDIAINRMTASISSNTAILPFQEGAGWEGTWDLPVCDMGTNDWNTDYGKRIGQYGKLPCCCGPNCIDTKAFVQAAGLLNFQTLLYGCEHQLKEDPHLTFDLIDYGFAKKKSFPLTWAAFSMGHKVGVGFGIAIAGLVVIGLIVLTVLLCCCC